MSDYTRRQLLGRGAAGASVLTIPGLLAACGGGGGGIKAASNTSKTTAAVNRKLAGTLNFSNWPLYIDVNAKTKKHPTLDGFTKKTGGTLPLGSSFFCRVPITNVPEGTSTVPPPSRVQASIAAWSAAVSSVLPSPFAPKVRML